MFFKPSAAWMVSWPRLPDVLPQSKVMMPPPSTPRPAPAARVSSELSGPPVPLPRVMYSVMPGLSALMIFSASTVYS